jgi:hypothetical protein
MPANSTDPFDLAKVSEALTVLNSPSFPWCRPPPLTLGTSVPVLKIRWPTPGPKDHDTEANYRRQTLADIAKYITFHVILSFTA